MSKKKSIKSVLSIGKSLAALLLVSQTLTFSFIQGEKPPVKHGSIEQLNESSFL